MQTKWSKYNFDVLHLFVQWYSTSFDSHLESCISVCTSYGRSMLYKLCCLNFDWFYYIYKEAITIFTPKTMRTRLLVSNLTRGDLSVLVSNFKGDLRLSWLLLFIWLVSDIIELASSFDVISFSWISKERNRIVDSLAKQCLLEVEAFMAIT